MLELTRFESDQRLATWLLAARGFEDGALTPSFSEEFVFPLCFAQSVAEIQSIKEKHE